MHRLRSALGFVNSEGEREVGSLFEMFTGWLMEEAAPIRSGTSSLF